MKLGLEPKPSGSVSPTLSCSLNGMGLLGHHTQGIDLCFIMFFISFICIDSHTKGIVFPFYGKKTKTGGRKWCDHASCATRKRTHTQKTEKKISGLTNESAWANSQLKEWLIPSFCNPVSFIFWGYWDGDWSGAQPEEVSVETWWRSSSGIWRASEGKWV